MRKHFFTYSNLTGDFPRLEENIRRSIPTTVFGMSDTLKHLTASLWGGPYLYVCADAVRAEKTAKDIETLSGEAPVLLTSNYEVLTFKKAVSKDILQKRIISIDRILTGNTHIVCDIEAALQLLPLSLPSVELKVGEEEDFTSLPGKLVSMGYAREYSPDSPGTFTVRGDVLDIWPVGEENPVRVDFFGDGIERIRSYDAVTGERGDCAGHIRFVAASDCFIDRDEIGTVSTQIRESLMRLPSAEAFQRASDITDGFEESAAAGCFPGASFYMPLTKNCGTVLDLLPQDSVIYYDECRDIAERAEGLVKEFGERFASLYRGGEVLDFSERQLMNFKDFSERAASFRGVGMQTFVSDTKFFSPLATIRMNCTPCPAYLGSEDLLMTDLRNWTAGGYRVIIFTDGASRAEKMRLTLADGGYPVSDEPESADLLRGIAVSSEALEHGAVLHGPKIVLIGNADIYLKSRTGSDRIRKRRGDMFISPDIGDYVVHERHGIGKITGTTKITTGDGTKEYISVEYSGGDLLHVPVEQMDLLSKYSGEENPPLSSLGGNDFERTKEKVRKSVRKIAIDLKALYAERSKKVGFRFDENAAMMDEFESEFPFEETPDQLASVAEIKADMCSDKVMDRLLCGDVGYGKTEVALRAVYLCVLSGKQAALLCPGTVLCEQHYNVAVERFREFGVSVAKLNRLMSVKDVNDTLRKLKKGEVDFVIGTHRLLSADVSFCDLGLLIVDEEQRFGVEHKEKIKNIKKNVDCLTMTATPIPRTLHMSLSGMRDISTINTAPQKRLPVQTYVVEESEVLIRDACVREISRGGQVFILYNRVETIENFAERIKEIVPEGKVVHAHGRMNRDTLERNVDGFYLGEYNILVTTTIIENGIDLPNANTIIIIDADRFGVSQLYQLRGRVGRSYRLAYAYLTYKPSRIMTEEASERLKAVMQFTELGSGYRIAMRDLEIRGAGDVLGAEQHGHMNKIGYELYSKILREELTGEKYVTPELEIATGAYIPDKYIVSGAARMDCYKQIAEIHSVDDYKRVLSSMEELYGEVPGEVMNLLIIASLKAYATPFNISKITVNREGGTLFLSSLECIKDGRLVAALSKYKNSVSIDYGNTSKIFFPPRNSVAGTMVHMTRFLRYACGAEKNDAV